MKQKPRKLMVWSVCVSDVAGTWNRGAPIGLECDVRNSYCYPLCFYKKWEAIRRAKKLQKEADFQWGKHMYIYAPIQLIAK